MKDSPRSLEVYHPSQLIYMFFAFDEQFYMVKRALTRESETTLLSSRVTMGQSFYVFGSHFSYI